MYYILYNPSSNDGKTIKKINKLYNDLQLLDECYKQNLLEIVGKEVIFLDSLENDDVVYLCGGDGTLNRFLNAIGDKEYKCKLLFYSCGSGNDFKRDFKNDKFIDLDPIRRYISKCYINGDEKALFVNGIGIGLDAVVCRSKNQLSVTGAKKSYFNITLSSFKKFRPYSLDLVIDGEKKHYDNVWTMICSNGKYMGGGMKVCPDAIRNDGIFELVIIHSLPKWLMIILFPLIYLGLHRIVKGVEYIKCKSLKAIPDGCTVLQMDGETLDYAREIVVEA